MSDIKVSQRYKKFTKLDGRHPWRNVSPDGYIDYPVRYRKGGRVLWFNFALAEELKLIPIGHLHKMNPKLEEAILQTFSLQIVNEYDQENQERSRKEEIRKHVYMATRYLQLQHENKQGKTSGDGRGIWNGYLLGSGKRVFDISSRGTGATLLSPGAAEVGRPLKTGDESVGYSSGLADLDEMLGSAVMSEIFYREGIPTERCLVVIDYKDNTGVGVRSAPNLIRPAHIFRYLKAGNWEELKRSFDYFIDRQVKNGALDVPKEGRTRYTKTFDYITRTYAKLAAVMEEEYIFNWMAWDGDNMLATGAMLDYGSIRQFAAKHNKYRYEDVDRFSTSLTEQKNEAKYIVQTFAQIIDFILTKEKRKIQEFSEDANLKLFEEEFEKTRKRRMLYDMGFSMKQIKKLMKYHQPKIEEFRKVLNYFEDIKTVNGEEKVPDGVDHPPIFLVRNILRELPIFYFRYKKGREWPTMPVEYFCHIMAASYVEQDDLEMTDYRKQQALKFQEIYKDLVHAASRFPGHALRKIIKRSSVINYEYRRTGDGLTWIVNESLKAKDTFDRVQFQTAIDRFIESQILIPGKWKPILPREVRGNSTKARLLRMMQENLEIYKERI